MKKLIEICNHCGVDVSFGTGFFVNRVPDFNDRDTRISNNLNYPQGDFVCRKCDSRSSDEYVFIKKFD